MAYAYVQGAVGTTGQSGATATVTLTGVAAGNLLVIGVKYASDSRSILGISGGGTWAAATGAANANAAEAQLWYCENATGGDTTATITFDSVAATSVTPMMAEYSGIRTTLALEGGNAAGVNGGATVASLSSGTVTPTSGGAYLVVGLGFVESTGRAIGDAGLTSRLYQTGITNEMRLVDTRLTSDAATAVTFGLTGGSGYMTSSVAIFEESAPAGPTIDTQPVADTVLINGDAARSSASFTVAASGTGTLSYQWELETSVGGGTYANVADGDGATWAGATSTNLTATFTVKTLTGRRVRCVVTDDNGSTTSSAVALTVYTGPVISKSSGTTNASGVDTLTCTSDYPNADGEFTVVTATAGGVTKQVALHYETPP